jgi:hypothetical protein
MRSLHHTPVSLSVQAMGVRLHERKAFEAARRLVLELVRGEA